MLQVHQLQLIKIVIVIDNQGKAKLIRIILIMEVIWIVLVIHQNSTKQSLEQYNQMNTDKDLLIITIIRQSKRFYTWLRIIVTKFLQVIFFYIKEFRYKRT